MKKNQKQKKLGFKDNLADELQNLAFIEGLLKDIIKGNDLPDIKKEIGLSDEHLEAIYGLAYNFHSQGLYEKAFELFKVLVLMKPQNYKFNYGSAACLQMMGEHVRAIQVFFSCALIQDNNPEPYFFALDSAVKLKDNETIMYCAQACLKRTKNIKKYSTMEKRVTLILKGLKGSKKDKKN